MLKTVSSITNAIGALNFKGTWNAATNTPTIVSGVGVKGDYFVVSVAGSTTIDGISNWGVGDWITYNGTVWQRVEGGADLNGVNLSVSGTTTLSNLTASTALALNASKEVVSVTNTGTGDNVLATAPTLVGDVTLSTGNLVVADTKGIDFSATPGTGTSELLADYEEGTWTPAVAGSATPGTYTLSSVTATYTKVGRLVTARLDVSFSAASGGAGNAIISGLPFAYKTLAALTGAGFAASLDTSASSSNGICIVNSTGVSASTLVLVLTIDNAGIEVVAIGAVSTSTRLLFSFSYEVA